MDTNLQPCPHCGSSTVDKAICLSWRSEFVGPLRRYRCALRPPATPSAGWVLADELAPEQLAAAKKLKRRLARYRPPITP